MRFTFTGTGIKGGSLIKALSIDVYYTSLSFSPSCVYISLSTLSKYHFKFNSQYNTKLERKYKECIF